MNRTEPTQAQCQSNAVQALGRFVWREKSSADKLQLPRLISLDLQYKEKPVHFRFPRHSHADLFELYYVDKGRISFTGQNGLRQTLSQREMLLLLPRQLHEIEGDAEIATNILTVHFRSPDLLQLCPELRGVAGQPIGFDPRAYELLNDLCSTARSPDRQRGRQAAANLILLLLRLVELSTDSPEVRPASRPRRAQKLCDELERYVQQHLHERLTLADMARAIGVSVSTLTHEYHRLSGKTPHELLRWARIERAKDLLRQGRSVKEVAFQTGFSSQSAFGRTFRCLEKMTPGVYLRTLSSAQPALDRAHLDD